MKIPTLSTHATAGILHGLVFFAATTIAVQGTVLTLDFNGGNGTTGVDQFTGTAGDGWATAWKTTFHSGIQTHSETVTNTNPLTADGDNYLQFRFGMKDQGGGLVARLYRQWDTSAVATSSPISLEFDIRSNVNLSSSSQSITIFGDSTGSVSGSYWTASSISFLITSSGAGWAVNTWNGTKLDAVAFDNGSTATGTVRAGETWRFKLTFDLSTNTYDVAITNTSVSGTTFTATGLAMRPGTSVENLSHLNFNAEAPANATDRGFDLDAINISSIPEPRAIALALGGVFLCCVIAHRFRRKS